MKVIKSKGFTLVELLAVIVILALIILIAMPAVIEVMEKSQASSFKNEVNEVARIVETAYSQKQLKNDNSITTITLRDKNGTDRQYRYMCMTLEALANENYTQKPFNDDDTVYKGKYEVFVPVGGGLTVYLIHFYNGQYTVDGDTYAQTSAPNYEPKFTDITGKANFNTCSGAPTSVPGITS